jgi:CRP-like cAMP-binding protein
VSPSVARSSNVIEWKQSTGPDQSLLSGLPEHLSASLFSNTTPVQLKADEVLFLAGDAGDGCYRVEDGLLKVTMVSRAGTERILAFLGSGAIVGELAYRRVAALGVRGGGAAGAVELS